MVAVACLIVRAGSSVMGCHLALSAARCFKAMVCRRSLSEEHVASGLRKAVAYLESFGIDVYA